MKSKKFLVVGILFMAIAAVFMLYPTVCNLINSFFSESAIETYNSNINTISASDKSLYLSEAEKYNNTLKNKVSSYSDTEYIDGYENILDFNDIIGYLKIDKINVSLPIYHGSNNDEEVLKKGAVHLPNTSFPIGGNGCHSVISAHTGYPNQVFFDNLPEIEKGDLISVTVLDETFTYSVSDKNIVTPDDTRLLDIDEDRDLLSLITCFPYGINSHRLIVRSERLKEEKINTPDESNSKSDSSDYYTVLYIFILFVLIFTLMIVITIIFNKRRKRRNK